MRLSGVEFEQSDTIHCVKTTILDVYVPFGV